MVLNCLRSTILHANLEPVGLCTCMYVNIMHAGKVLLIKDYPVKQKIECDN